MTEKTQNASKNVREKTSSLFCPADRKCGGCRYLKMPYEEQLKLKRERVAKLLKPSCSGG